VIEKVLFGLASALVFEGLILAVVPNRMKKAVQLIEKASTSTLSICGLLMMVIGILFLSMIEI
jgi:uncharacterized protein YjeT (DUF2065 family)